MRFICIVLTTLCTLLCTLLCTFFASFFCTSLVFAQSTKQDAAQSAKQDAVLLDMAAAFKKGDSRTLSRLLPSANGHILEPWAAYYELKARLDSAQAADLAAFFKRYANTYVEDRLRAEWLLLLGARRDWTSFAAYHSAYRMGDDKDINCYARHVEVLKTGQISIASIRQIERDWMSQTGVNTGCGYVANGLIDAGKMAPIVAWRKNLPVEPSARASAAAKKAYERSLEPQKDWTEQQRNWALGLQGRRLALRHDLEALDVFASVTRLADLSDEMLAWWARALMRTPDIRVSDWKRLDTVISAMSVEFKTSDAAWTYWQGQAKRQMGQADEAKAIWQTISFGKSATLTGFYEQLALQELGGKFGLTGVAQTPAAHELERVPARQNAGLLRALYAIELGLRPDGVREWNYEVNLAQANADGSRGMNDRERQAAAALACERSVWDRCINTADRSKTFVDWAQRYPTPFLREMQSASKLHGVDLALMYGLIRQESRFQADARSSVGAYGLMQLMPATAKWMAKQQGVTGFSPSDVGDVDVNLSLGTGYLRLLIDDFAGSGAGNLASVLAVAGYNAGPGRPRSWRNALNTPKPLSILAWIENIPFNETRDYVKKVISNTKVYSERLGLTGATKIALDWQSILYTNKNIKENIELP